VVPGLDGRKMSKSYDNTIEIFDDPKTILKKCKKIVTDSTPVEAPKDPDRDNLFQLFRLFAPPDEVGEVDGRYRAGGIGYGEVKTRLAEHIARQIVARQAAGRAEVRIAARYPLERRTPVTGLATQEMISIIGIAAATKTRVRRIVGVEATGINACPCAQGLVRGKAGVYPELKSPPLYTRRGLDMVRIFVDSVKKLGLDRPDSLKSTPVIIQSFDEGSVRRVSTELPTIPRVFLTENDEDVTDARLRELSTFASGIAPEKRVIARHPDMVGRAHAVGLTVTSWTFSATEKTQYGSVRDEMSQYLYTWGIDALFTNNPDQFPRR